MPLKTHKPKGVYGRLIVIPHRNAKKQDRVKEILATNDVWKYKSVLLKNKIKLMNKALSTIKPEVCLNNIRAIAQKGNTNARVVGPTRKGILKKYLAMRINKLEKHSDMDDADPEVVEGFVSAMMDHILTGNINDEEKEELFEDDAEKALAKFYGWERVERDPDSTNGDRRKQVNNTCEA